MTKLQLILIVACVALFGVLYFGFDTKSSSFQEVERSRSLSSSIDVDQLISAASDSLSSTSKFEIGSLKDELSNSGNDKDKIDVLKKISGFWFKKNRQDISGHYASKIAEMENTAESWNIAGSTYTLGLQQLSEGASWDFCYESAISSYQNALSIDPEFVDSRINLALCFVEKAPKDNPMKGITMLLDLNKQHPENIAVMTNLGKLAVRTNQLDKARIRFEKILELEKDNRTANCYLSEIYKGLGDIAKAAQFAALCQNL